MDENGRPVNARPYLLVLGAASCWGTIGVVYALLPRWVAIGPVTIVFLRATSAFAILLAFTATARRDALRVNWRELPFLALFGLVSIAAFYVVLIYAFRSASVGVTTVLLYLAPAFVTVVSALALREPLSASKLLALGCCLTGAILVAEPWAGQGLRVGVKGLVLGLLSALTYGSYSLLGKVGLRRHRPLTREPVPHLLEWSDETHRFRVAAAVAHRADAPRAAIAGSR